MALLFDWLTRNKRRLAVNAFECNEDDDSDEDEDDEAQDEQEESVT